MTDQLFEDVYALGQKHARQEMCALIALTLIVIAGWAWL